MGTATRADQRKTDEYGIERANADNPGAVGKLREKWGWFDHVMRMQERFGEYGGNQYSAGITYFSVLSMFPLLMLSVAVAATVLASQPDTLAQLQERIVNGVEGELATTLNEILETAIDQRAAMFGIGGLTALWSGLGWMNHLRYGVSKMWKYPVTGGNFVVTKLKDLLGLIGLLIALIIAFGVTAVGSSGLTESILGYLNLDEVPGIFLLVRAVAILVGLIANFAVFLWLMKYLPRGEVPMKAAVKASLIGAVGFEIFKQVGAMFFSSALSNPAGAAFGPIIGVMVLLYFVWRIVMYCAAWAATTDEALVIAHQDAPAPAVIRVREIRDSSSSKKMWGLAAGAAALVALFK